jgi:archaemetzincin
MPDPSLTLVPATEVARDDVADLVRELAALGLSATLGPAVRLPAGARDARRAQYRADKLLEVARRTPRPGLTVLITEEDLYADDLNFVFGLADAAGSAAVVSLFRLRLGAGSQLTRERAVKEVVHEVGHCLGLGHCPDPRCVMYFSNSLADTDRKGKGPCARCTARLPWAIRVPGERSAQRLRPASGER